MKTWEMIKELMENPKKKFVSDKGKKYEMVAYINEHNNICFEYADKVSFIGIHLPREWEEIKQPVDFMTAFNAWSNECKTIKYELDGSTYTLPSNLIVKFCPREIKYAKWYIVD